MNGPIRKPRESRPTMIGGEEEEEDVVGRWHLTASRSKSTKSSVSEGEDKIGRKSRKMIPDLGKFSTLTIASFTR